MTTTRLNKYIGETGFCSRREADRLIADRRVTVNGMAAGMGTVVGRATRSRSMARRCVCARRRPAGASMSTSR